MIACKERHGTVVSSRLLKYVTNVTPANFYWTQISGAGRKIKEKEACSTGKFYGRLKGSFFQRKSRECCLLTSNKKLQEAVSLIFTFLSFALKYFNKAKKGKIGI